MGENIKIVADSCCEPTPEMIGDQQTAIVPFYLTVCDKEFIDDENLNIKEFLMEMKACPRTPKSACPTPYDFENAVGDAKKSFIITISSNLSGTYDSAVIAAKNIMEKISDTKVHVFNSLSAVAGETLVYLKVKELIEKGIDFDAIAQKIDNFIKNDMNTLILLENVENLVKNGRMSKVAGTIATFLSIQPILYADNGDILIFDKTIGMKKAVIKLVDSIDKVCKDVKERTLVITHCNNPERASLVKQKVEEKYNFKKIYVNEAKGLGTLYANDGGVVLAF